MDDDARQRMAQMLMAPQAGELSNLPPTFPSQLRRSQGLAGLREQMGGEPAFWGPLQRLIFGYPLNGTNPDIVRMLMQGQMGQSQEVSDAVPRPPIRSQDF